MTRQIKSIIIHCAATPTGKHFDAPVYPHEADAFVSLACNIGASTFCKSTLVKKLKQTPPDYAGSCAKILRWNRAGGRVMAELKKRRQWEYELCTQSDGK